MHDDLILISENHIGDRFYTELRADERGMVDFVVA
jgi:hypothetical protein